MSGLLLFGKLQDRELRRIVAGADLPGEPAAFPGQGVFRACGGDWPVLAEGPGAGGIRVRPTPDMLDRFDFYAAAFGYRREAARAVVGGEPLTGWVYRPEAADASCGEPWSLAEWQRDWGPLARQAAREAMRLYGQLTPAEIARAMPTIRLRAASRLRAAAAPAPVHLRAGFTARDIRIAEDGQPYTGYFAVRETVLSHPRFAGGYSRKMRRAAWVSGDAVTVLPYDPVRDRVLLVEQFRVGPFARGDRYPWSLEPIAGRIDAGEDAATAARREAREEAGLTLDRLVHVADYYPSPGAVTEYLYTYVGLADLPDGAAGLGGLDAENEDIRAHVLGFAELEALIATGEIDNAPLLVTALWLAPRRFGDL